MKVNIKAVIALVLMCVLTVAAGACGGGDDGGESGSTSAQKVEPEGTLTVWDNLLGSFAPYDAVAKKLDAEFEAKYPKVTLKHVPQPYATYEQTYKAAFAAQEGPDVMAMAGGVSGVLNYKPGLEPLGDLIPPDMEENITNWQSVTPGFTEDGEHYGIPVVINAYVFYYNKDMFEKAGLPREFEPKTWDELREAGEKLKAAGIQPFVGGNKEGYENTEWFSVAWQGMATKEQTVELAEGELPYTDELVAEAFGPLLMMQEAGLYSSDRFTTPVYPQGRAMLGEGKGAISIGQMALAGHWGESVPELGAKNVGTFIAPGSEFIGVEPNWAWAMPKFAKNKDAARAWLEFVGSREAIQTLADDFAEFPNRKDVELPAGYPPQPYELEDDLRAYETFPVNSIMMPPGVQEVLRNELNQVLQGRTSLEDALQAMQETAERTGG